MVKLPQFLETFVNARKETGKGKTLSVKEKWMLLLLSGVLLAVILFPVGKKNEKQDVGVWESGINTVLENENEEISSLTGIGSAMRTLKQYETCLSQELKGILEQIDGAGAVEAWVTLAGSSEKVLYLEKDSDNSDLQEADSVGGTRSEKTENIDQKVLLDSSGNPYIIKTLQPEVEGVLVVAEGAGDSVVKKNITEAVQVLFGIDAHRIKVAKKKVED